MPKTRTALLAAPAIAAIAVAAACGGDDTSGADADALPVVATTSIVADIVENVGGDDVSVTTLVGRNSDAHTFEPEPADVEAITDAALVFEIGLGFEEWLEASIDASGSDATVVTLSEAIEPIAFEGEHSHSDEEGEAHSDEEDGHDHSEDEDGHDHSEEKDDAHAHEEDGHDHSEDEDGHDHSEEEKDDAHSEDDEAHSEDEDGHDGHSHAEGEDDPHVWMTAANGIAMTEVVATALAEADPDNADAYEERAAAYTAEIEEAQDEIVAALAAVPPASRVLFTNHDAFGYFAEEHDFEVLGSALSSVTTEGADPSAGEVAAVVKEIEESGVPMIFPENVANPDLLETIASEAGVTVGPELATGALGEEGSDAGTYVGLLRSNAQNIGSGLSS